MQSRFFENTVAELMEGMGDYSDLALRRALSRSCMLSSDVSAGYDPAYAECFEKKNSAYLEEESFLNKYTGARENQDPTTPTRNMWQEYEKSLTITM